MISHWSGRRVEGKDNERSMTFCENYEFDDEGRNVRSIRVVCITFTHDEDVNIL